MKLEIKLNSYELNKFETMITPIGDFCMKKRIFNSLESTTDLFKMVRKYADAKYLADHKAYSVLLRKDKDDNYVVSFDLKYNFIDTITEFGSKYGKMIIKVLSAIFEFAHSGAIHDLDELSDDTPEDNTLLAEERVAVIGRKPVLFKKAWKSDNSVEMEKAIMDGCITYANNHDATETIEYVENIMRLNPCTVKDNKKFFYDLYLKYEADCKSDIAKYLYQQRLGVYFSI